MTTREKRAVVIEDDADVRTLLEVVLRTEGWDCISGASIDDVAGTLAFADVVLLDHHLIGMNGLEILAQIRDLGLDVAVVMLTADPVPRERAELLGVERFFLKPFDVSELVGVLRGLTHRLSPFVVDLRDTPDGAFVDEAVADRPWFATR